MKTRQVTLAAGQSFTVPQGIQRLDSASTRGWQVRYQGTLYFADGTSGPEKALTKATRELLKRIATLPAPVSLRSKPSPSKSTQLPAGISGPILLNAENPAAASAVLSVLIPRFGETNQVKTVHIGTPETYTEARYRQALAKANGMRAEALAEYAAAATKAKRRAATALKKELAASRKAA